MLFRVASVSAVASGLWLLRNLYNIFMVLPDEALQGPVYRILYFHVPAWWTAFLAVGVAAFASVMYLIRKQLQWDSIAVATTEVGLVFLLMGISLGSIWGRIAWGIWWTWDARLTSALICVLLYAGYLGLRNTIDDPTQRATASAVFSLFALCDVPIVWYSIRWWRTQHPAPMDLPRDMMSALLHNWGAMMLLVLALILIRFEQEQAERRIASRRLAKQEMTA